MLPYLKQAESGSVLPAPKTAVTDEPNPVVVLPNPIGALNPVAPVEPLLTLTVPT